MRALFDTNIIIDYLNGEEKALNEVQLYQDHHISIITYMEVLVGIDDLEEFDIVKKYLLSLSIVHINQVISDLAIDARKKYKLKIPDALIMASAQKIGAILVTRNNKDFDVNIPIVRIPYQL